MGGDLNSVMYAQNIVQHVLLLFMQQYGDGLIQRNINHVLYACAIGNDLHNIRQFSRLALSPELSSIEHVWNMVRQRPTTSVNQSIPYFLICALYDQLHIYTYMTNYCNPVI